MPLGNKENPWGYLAVFIAIVFVALLASFLFVTLSDTLTGQSTIELVQTEGEELTVIDPLTTEANSIDTTENRVNLTLLDGETGESAEITNLYDDPSNGDVSSTVSIRSKSITVTNNGVIGGDSTMTNGTLVHTTDDDFNGADTLDGMAVVGSGVSADVVTNSSVGSQITIDDFEDGDLSEYSGDVGDFTVDSDPPVIEGTNSLKVTDPGGGVAIFSDSLGTISQGDSVAWYVNTLDNNPPRTRFGAQDGINHYSVQHRPGPDDLRLYETNGGTATVLSSVSVPLNTSTWYEIVVVWSEDGMITAIIYDVDQTTGERQGELARVSAVDTTFESGGVAFRTGSASGTAAWDDYRILREKATYISQTHSQNGVEEGFTNITLLNTTAHVTWIADTDGDGSFETEAGSGEFTATGNHTIDLSGTDSSSWRVNVTMVPDDGDSMNSSRIHDEGVVFQSESGQSSTTRAVISYEHPARYSWTEQQSDAVDALIVGLAITFLLVIVGGVGYYAIGGNRS